MKAAAERRILDAADAVAARLVWLAHHAESESAAVTACRDLLDRAGLGARQRVSADVTHHEVGQRELDLDIERLLAERDAAVAQRLGLGEDWEPMWPTE